VVRTLPTPKLIFRFNSKSFFCGIRASSLYEELAQIQRRLGIHLSLNKILQPNRQIAPPTKVLVDYINSREVSQAAKMIQKTENTPRKGRLRAFLDFFVLFSGVSTASNLERTQRRPLITRGLFLFRGKKRAEEQC
jgi:hypothetical protein